MESPSKITPKVEIQEPDDRLTLPGFGLRLDYTPEAMNSYGVRTRSLFPTVLDDRDIEAGYIECVDSISILNIRKYSCGQYQFS
jgi:hypothetical protein